MPDTSNLIYISYRWKGAKLLADRLAAGLIQEFGSAVEVFQDTASLKPGDVWPALLQQALGRASVLLALIDKDWVLHSDEFGRRKLDNESDWVRLEIEKALSREILIIPILVDGAEMPPAQALPDSLVPLTQFQTFRCSVSGFPTEFPVLVDRLKAYFSGAEAQANRVELPFQVLDLEISNFRCFRELQVEFAGPSTLPGQWTCLAGINGAGKSTILQALALILMGPENARELGGSRLASLRRRDSGTKSKEANTWLRSRVAHLGEEFVLEMTIDGKGARSKGRDHWAYLNESLVVGYGASRNLSDAPEKYDTLSPIVRACISMFDSMARLESAEKLIMEGGQSLASTMFRKLIGQLFQEEFQVLESKNDKGIRFQSKNSDKGPSVSGLELPDGFRSSVAWIADLCTHWSRIYGQSNSQPSLKDMTGIVMIDEVDLHLHASLQRSIIPRLRSALPNIQFIVSSHSPLILSSFDMHELILLDTDEENGIREIDRQIIGFSPDQVYEWLLGTPASSEALDRFMSEADKLRESGKEISEVIGVSPDIDSEQARARMQRIKSRIQKMKR